MADRVPARLRVAVDVVDPAPDARVLEVGCGPGVAMALLCPRLPEGHVTGLDRSATAIERAERRLARHLDAGVADLQHRELAGFHGDGRPYDEVFAVNVNLFWAADAHAEVTRLCELLAPSGSVRLFYELPGGVASTSVAGRVSAALERGGLVTAVTTVDDVLCVTGRPAPA